MLPKTDYVKKGTYRLCGLKLGVNPGDSVTGELQAGCKIKCVAYMVALPETRKRGYKYRKQP